MIGDFANWLTWLLSVSVVRASITACRSQWDRLLRKSKSNHAFFSERRQQTHFPGRSMAHSVKIKEISWIFSFIKMPTKKSILQSRAYWTTVGVWRFFFFNVRLSISLNGCPVANRVLNHEKVKQVVWWKKKFFLRNLCMKFPKHQFLCFHKVTLGQTGEWIWGEISEGK